MDRLNGKLKDEHFDRLYEAILSLENRKECADFFEDLCTVAELKAMSQRYWVAELLESGHLYNDIVKMTGASTTTISRVNRSLTYGSDGYSVVLKRLNKK